LPARFADAPELDFGNELFFYAFDELSSCRDTGMGLGPIPLTAILAYSDAYSLDFEFLTRIIRPLDERFLHYYNKKVSAEIKK
jgi:hypothetical protein